MILSSLLHGKNVTLPQELDSVLLTQKVNEA